MAVIFADGFDWYASSDYLKQWTGSGSGSSATVVVGAAYSRAPSGQGMSCTFTNSHGIYKSFGANYVSGALGFAFQFVSVSTSSAQIAMIGDGNTEQISIRTNASSVLTVSRNGTLLTTGTTVLSSSTWYYIELKFTINNTTGVVEMHLNGATEISSTGSLNTRNTANAQWNYIELNRASATIGQYVFDDVYVLDTSTGSNTTFLGPVSVIARYPAANGNYAQWTPNGGSNMGCVSEPYEDGDTSFNTSSTANQIDTFAMQDINAASGSVYAVSHHMVARQDAGAARTVAPLLRIGGADYVGSTDALSSSYQFLTQVYDVSPATSTAWTVSEVNGLEAGYKLIS